MLRLKEVTDYTPDFNKIIGDFSHRLRSVREPGGSERENKVFELDDELCKWSFGSVAEMLFDKRFGCLEEEIKEEFLAHQIGRDESIFEDSEAFKPER